MAVGYGEDQDPREPIDPRFEPEQGPPSWASELMAPARVGDAPRVLLDDVDGIEVWGLIAPWEAEELVDRMDSWPTARAGERSDA